MGEDFWPETLDREVVDRYVVVDDSAVFRHGAPRGRSEGLLVGGSGGMAVHAAAEVAAEDTGKLVVVLLPDSGRGYLSKIWNEEWLAEHGLG